MKLTINNFKSIESLELDLSRTTILIGPPASGKSNILDAIAILGYWNRLRLVDKEYGNSFYDLEDLLYLARYKNYEDIFRNYDLTKKIQISIKNEFENKIEIFYRDGKMNVTINDNLIPWDIISKDVQTLMNVKITLEKIFSQTPLLDSRLYSYNRYGLLSPDLSRNFIYMLKNKQKNFPTSILSEMGYNGILFTRTIQDIVRDINYYLSEDLEEKIEIKVSKTGAITIYDYDIEIESYNLSSSIFMIIYYLMAIRTSANYMKKYGLENKMIVCFEEPEANVFPYLIDLLPKYIIEYNEIYFVLTTHNPLLISSFGDKIKDLKIYYVYRNFVGATEAVEIDIEKMAKKVVIFDEIFKLSPSEVINNYGKKKE